MSVRMALADMRTGQTGEVVGFEGGHGMTVRLGSMGIRPGVVLKVVNRSFLGGPVSIRFGNAQVALGRGMARKVVVAVEDDTGKR